MVTACCAFKPGVSVSHTYDNEDRCVGGTIFSCAEFQLKFVFRNVDEFEPRPRGIFHIYVATHRRPSTFIQNRKQLTGKSRPDVDRSAGLGQHVFHEAIATSPLGVTDIYIGCYQALID